MDSILVVLATVFSGWLLWPPRGERAGPLLGALTLWWGTLVLIGLARGVVPGRGPWLVLLALIGALVALTIVWSAVTLLGRERVPRPSDPTDD